MSDYALFMLAVGGKWLDTFQKPVTTPNRGKGLAYNLQPTARNSL